MEKVLQAMYLAELKEGKSYAFPVEELRYEDARIISDLAKCQVVLLPRICFELNLKSLPATQRSKKRKGTKLATKPVPKDI